MTVADEQSRWNLLPLIIICLLTEVRPPQYFVHLLFIILVLEGPVLTQPYLSFTTASGIIKTGINHHKPLNFSQQNLSTWPQHYQSKLYLSSSIILISQLYHTA